MTTNTTDKNTIKSWFRRGIKPLESQFAAWMDSYWHKQEQIPTSSIEGLEKTLNNKAELATQDELRGQLDTHRADDLRHKTEDDRDKLQHLAADANATYATRQEIGGITPLVFHATYTDNLEIPKRIYVLTDKNTVRDQLTDYFLNNRTNPILLVTTPEEGTTGYDEMFVMTSKRAQGIARETLFETMRHPIQNDTQYSHIIKVSISILSTGSVVGANITSSIIDKPYDSTRYTPSAPFDINDWKKSGGITALTSETVIGTNIPQGFSAFSGFVLANPAGATQIITDGILQKTMLRSYTINPGTGVLWTPWQEIGTPVLPIITFTATKTVAADTGIATYTIDTDQANQFAAYFAENKTNPVQLKLTTIGDVNDKTITLTLNSIEIQMSAHRMKFILHETPALITTIRLQASKTFSQSWTGYSIYTYPTVTEESEYKSARYVTYEPYDMNNWQESGGISALAEDPAIENAIVGANVPVGFTDFYGFVLKNDGEGRGKTCSTQFVTDKILKKTCFRSSFVTTARPLTYEWTPWQEIGAPIPGVHLVGEYPADLSAYPDGSIFIKQ